LISEKELDLATEDQTYVDLRQTIHAHNAKGPNSLLGTNIMRRDCDTQIFELVIIIYSMVKYQKHKRLTINQSSSQNINLHARRTNS